MKKLNKKDTAKVRLLKGRISQNASIYDEVALLKLEESILFGIEEWKSKTSPSITIHAMTQEIKRGGTDYYENSPRGKQFLGKKFSIRRTADRLSWLVVRIK